MENLIIESSNWLRSDQCSKGSIQDRTQGVLGHFKKYLRRNKDELESLTGKPINYLVNDVVVCQTVFGAIISAYLRGVHHIAVTSAHSFVKEITIGILPKGARLYKARVAESNYLFSQDEMFHIPYEKRNKIGNQRFSVSGLPCLYLGSSSYICWEELGRVDFSACNFCGFTNISDVDLYDLALPVSISSASDIKRICLILACSLSAKREDLFKEEYILPQCIFQALILRHHYYHSNKKTFGIKYFSAHVLNGDADCFKIDFSDSNWNKRFINYVFPAASTENSGFSSLLKSVFNQSETTTMMIETLLSPDKLVSGRSNDVYLDSQFGLMDAYLDERMGYKPLRREATFLTI